MKVKNVPENVRALHHGAGSLDFKSEYGPVPAVVERLEELLEKAKRGEIRAFAHASIAPGGVLKTGWINSDKEHSMHMLMASISYLQSEYAAKSWME